MNDIVMIIGVLRMHAFLGVPVMQLGKFLGAWVSDVAGKISVCSFKAIETQRDLLTSRRHSCHDTVLVSSVLSHLTSWLS